MVAPVTGTVPDPASFETPDDRSAAERALAYMGLRAGTPIAEIRVDRVFLGSCTNGRIEDLRAAAAVVRGKRVASSVRAMVVPGSGLVKAQAEQECSQCWTSCRGFAESMTMPPRLRQFREFYRSVRPH